MKVCLLFGSPHPNGGTASLLNEYLSSLPAEVTVYRFDLYDTPVSPCLGCGGCRSTGRCVLPDMDALYKTLEECDEWVIATPLYCLSAPAPLKAVFDRLQPYFERRFSLGQIPPVEKHRTATLLVSYGSDKYGGVSHLTETVRMLCTVLNADLTTVITKKGLPN